MRSKSVVLIGFMGCGKSTIGKELSNIRKIPCIDTDEYIVEKEGRSINEIFETEGEEFFRNLETEAVKEISRSDKAIILAVGGGLVMRDINVGYLKAIGKIVYLRASKECLYERLSGDKTRPLLKGEDLMGKIDSLMEKRRERYESVADMIIDTDGVEISEICKKIIC